MTDYSASTLQEPNTKLWSRTGTFEAPTVAELVDRLQTRAEARPPLVAQGRPEHLPLSYSQQRLWFIDRMEGRSPQYNVPEALRLRGALNIEALVQALHAIVDRHESLRTRFAEFNGNPVQIVAPSLQLDVPVEILSNLPKALVEERIAAAFAREWEEPFDLAHGPLFRVRLLKLGEKDYLLLRTFHHIVYDAWSHAILNWEFGVLYQAFSEGRENPLPPLTVQYPDFAVWQRTYLGEALSRSLEYWKKQLAEIPGQIELPRDRARPAMQTFNADVCQASLPAEILDNLQQLGHAHRATLYMTLMAVFAVLLQRYSGQNDLVIGSPITDRREAQLERLIGLFVNSLLIRVKIDPGISFRELLDSVRMTTLEAFEHEDLPFEKLVEELSPQRDLSVTPLHQVMFILQNSPVESQQLAGLEVERVQMPGLRLHFDLELYVCERDRRLEFQWVYNRDLFAHWRIEQMARHYVRLLSAVVAAPDAIASKLEMLSIEEKQQILSEWNRTEAAYPRNKCVHHLLQEQAEKTPGSVALTCGNQSITYAELNQRANRLARYLRKQGVHAEVRVGLCMERCPEMVVAMLGILKAGGSYVPLDVNYPAARLRYMVQDARLQLLLTQQSVMEKLPRIAGRWICLDRLWNEIAKENDQDLESGVCTGNLAYVIYTSGSTGKPKGVEVEHRSIVRLVKGTNYVELGKGDVVLQLASVSFDAATFEIWGSLLNGCRLVIFPEEMPSLNQLARTIETSGITVLWLTSGLFNQMVDTQLARLHGVRQLLAGGDVLSPTHVRKALAELGETCLINGYGPTENTTFSCCHRMRAEDGNTLGETVPIGQPISNSRAYVLDQELNPVPVGVSGDLYLGGDGLARGYLNRPEMTAERFLPDPWSGNAGSRLYRTGDLARYFPDGRLEFLGRNDHQIKLRGFRIELGEAEAALKAEPDVLDALVTVRESRVYGKQLVGYVVAASGAVIEPDDLRNRLRRTLPEYVVPSAILVLPSWPLTSNGKIDRQALPDPSAKTVTAGFAVPESDMEKTIASIWQRALHLEKVSIHSNFFDLGGHSLLTIQVHTALQEVTNSRIAVTDLFKYPTIASLAKYLAGNDGVERDGSAGNTEVVKFKPGRSRAASSP